MSTCRNWVRMTSVTAPLMMTSLIKKARMTMTTTVIMMMTVVLMLKSWWDVGVVTSPPTGSSPGVPPG